MEPNSEGVEYETNILIKEPRAGERPAANAGYAKPTSLPYNMKVLSMQWRKTDQANTPMGTYDKFEIGKSYLLDLRIGFDGGEEKGYVYPKNWKEFKVNGKSVNAWMEYDDSTNGHVLRVYESYKVLDPSTVGSLAGTVKSYNSATDPVTVQLFRSGSSAAAYITTATGNTAPYTLSGITPGTYIMKASKKDHINAEYELTIESGLIQKDVTLRLIGDIDSSGSVTASDALAALQCTVRKLTLSGDDFTAADANADGRISTVDALRILQYAVGKIDGFSA